jgi:hypothetical protein
VGNVAYLGLDEKKRTNRREIEMELNDIRTSYNGEVVLGEPGKEKPHGENLHLYEVVLEKLSLDPSKLQLNDEFEGRIKFKIESITANSVGIEITHMGIEPEKKETNFMSSK